MDPTEHNTAPAAGSSAERVAGNKGIWVGITCIFIEFIVLFTVCFVARAHFPEAFHTAAELLSHLSGTLITLFVISSSFCVAASVATIRAGPHCTG